MAKQAAARAAAQLVQDGMRIGLGSGSTTDFFHEALGERIRTEGLRIQGVAPSTQTEANARQQGIPLVEPGTLLDLAVDGADEVDPDLNLIKGGGGALVREKIVAASAPELIIIADIRKSVPTLGTFPLPVAIMPFAWRATKSRIESTFGVSSTLRGGESTPFVSDDGLYILDIHFSDANGIPNPAETEARLRSIVGVAECGLFVCMTTRVLFGHPDGSVEEVRTLGKRV